VFSVAEEAGGESTPWFPYCPLAVKLSGCDRQCVRRLFVASAVAVTILLFNVLLTVHHSVSISVQLNQRVVLFIQFTKN
jgi:hypothetical protein